MLLILKELDTVTKELFNIKLYNYQKEIVEAIFSNNRKVTIKATTRAGKSYTLALSLLLYILCYPKTKIGIIATTQHKTKIIYSYIADFLASSPELAAKFDIKVPKDDISRLRAEASKQKLTTKQGGYIEVLTADLPSQGQALMGRAYDVTAIDESAELTPEAWSKIYRMLVENPKSKMVEIYNPWFLNHTYDHWNDPEWTKIHIPWQKCVEEGRMTKEAVEDQRRNLTELEFSVLFNAEFPENIENSVFKKAYLDLACRKKEFKDYDKILIGADIAAGGKDFTVITICGQKDNEFSFIGYKKIDSPDTMLTVGEIKEIASKYKTPIIQIDAVGFGKGVIDRLKESKYNAYSYIAGQSATEKKRYYNRKSEDLFGLSDIMKQGRFYNLPENSPFILEARKITYEIRSDRLLKTIDPEDKSPDHLDGLNICCARPKGGVSAFTLNI